MNSSSPSKGSSLVEDSRRSGDSNTTSGKLSTTDDVDVDFTGSCSVTKTRSDKGSYDIVSPELFRDVHNKHIVSWSDLPVNARFCPQGFIQKPIIFPGELVFDLLRSVSYEIFIKLVAFSLFLSHPGTYIYQN